eukprot:1180006-Prorocentrum_minimum.AAC.5
MPVASASSTPASSPAPPPSAPSFGPLLRSSASLPFLRFAAADLRSASASSPCARVVSFSLTHSLTHSLNYFYLLARLLTHSLTCALTRQSARSLTHPLIHSLIHSLTHSDVLYTRPKVIVKRPSHRPICAEARGI